jgi:gas vesicle protein
LREVFEEGPMKSFLVGLGIGLGLGVLFAPRSGEETRYNIQERASDLAEQARETVEQARERLRGGKKAVRGAAESTATETDRPTGTTGTSTN